MHHLRGNAIPTGHVQNPLSDSYKIKPGEGSPRSAPFNRGFRNVCWSPSKSSKYALFVI